MPAASRGTKPLVIAHSGNRSRRGHHLWFSIRQPWPFFFTWSFSDETSLLTWHEGSFCDNIHRWLFTLRSFFELEIRICCWKKISSGGIIHTCHFVFEKKHIYLFCKNLACLDFLLNFSSDIFLFEKKCLAITLWKIKIIIRFRWIYNFHYINNLIFSSQRIIFNTKEKAIIDKLKRKWEKWGKMWKWVLLNLHFMIT